MMWTPTSAIQVIAPILLTLTVLSLWMVPRAWPVFLVLTFLAGCVSGQLEWWAGFTLTGLAASCYLYAMGPGTSEFSDRLRRVTSFYVIVVMAFLLAAHHISAFHNIQVLPPTRLTPRSIPYDQWINFDKTLAGVLILGILYRKPVTTTAQRTAALLWRSAIPLIVTIASVIVLGKALGYIQWDPKWTSQFWPWAAINLLSTCMSEEAFFRAFLQTEIERWTAKRPNSAVIAITCSAILFGLSHVAGGWRYVALATVAGAGYGTVFYRTRRIEASILAHFTLNTVHFLLFTYPAAAAH